MRPNRLVDSTCDDCGGPWSVVAAREQIGVAVVIRFVCARCGRRYLQDGWTLRGPMVTAAPSRWGPTEYKLAPPGAPSAPSDSVAMPVALTRVAG